MKGVLGRNGSHVIGATMSLSRTQGRNFSSFYSSSVVGEVDRVQRESRGREFQQLCHRRQQREKYELWTENHQGPQLPERKVMLWTRMASTRPMVPTTVNIHLRTMATKAKKEVESSADTLPLSGITVLTLEQAIAAPFCTRQLADQGARVIKIERPVVGDFARHYDDRVFPGLSSHFTWTNRGKESLALDLKNPADLGVVKQVIKKCKVDVLVQNLAPGAADRLGLGWEKLQKDGFEDLIVCDISGYGSNGPYRDKKAYDLLIQSEAGLLGVTGSEPSESLSTSSPSPDDVKDETGMAKVGISIADISAAMYAYSSILAAILRRQKTGQGERIDISMLECMVEWMGFPMYYTYQGAPSPSRAGASHAAIYPYGPFETGGDGEVMLGIQNEREWVKFCDIVLSAKDLASDGRFVNNKLRSDNRTELKKIICERFASMNTEQVLSLLERAGIANAKVNDMKGVWDHPQLRARKRWTKVETPGGVVPALLPPGMAVNEGSPSNLACMKPVPDVGEHNLRIFAEAGINR